MPKLLVISNTALKKKLKNFAETIFKRLFANNEESSATENETPEMVTADESSFSDHQQLKVSIVNIINPKRSPKHKSPKPEMNNYENIGGQRSERLNKIYSALLTIKPTLTMAQRVFSVAGSICTQVRNRKSCKLLNSLMFLKYVFLNKNKI
jgi:hypothetical protein